MLWPPKTSESDFREATASALMNTHILTLPGAAHADLILAYLKEHDSSTAGILLVNNVDYDPCPSWDLAYTDGNVLSPSVAHIGRDR